MLHVYSDILDEQGAYKIAVATLRFSCLEGEQWNNIKVLSQKGLFALQRHLQSLPADVLGLVIVPIVYILRVKNFSLFSRLREIHLWSYCRQLHIENMGLWISRIATLFNGWKGEQARILMLGLDSAGKIFHTH